MVTAQAQSGPTQAQAQLSDLATRVATALDVTAVPLECLTSVEECGGRAERAGELRAHAAQLRHLVEHSASADALAQTLLASIILVQETAPLLRGKNPASVALFPARRPLEALHRRVAWFPSLADPVSTMARYLAELRSRVQDLAPSQTTKTLPPIPVPTR